MLKEGSTVKIYLTKDGTNLFEPCKNGNIFKKFYPEVATNIVKQLPVAPNKVNTNTIEDYHADVFNNKKKVSVIQCIRRCQKNSVLNVNKAPGMD